ncbi:MAG: C45 family peptidase [Acidimicrobiia bacterium]|nr:C45 family peptidase [Acidimicrobiia bacterium]
MTQPIRVIEMVGTATRRGQAHGRYAAEEIKEYTADRLARSGDGTDLGPEDLLALAEAMLDDHESYDADLYEEMCAMAASAGISPAEAVVVGGYTDFIDTVRAHARRGPVEDNCTAVIVPDSRAAGAGFLAQTWDMHASATQHIVMLAVRPDTGPNSLVFTTVGAIGQIGMNEAGIAVGINNLTADDGQIGVTWPFVVRKALAQSTFDAAVKCVTEAKLAGGHNFLIFDREGNGVSIEAMPTVAHAVAARSDVVTHTNHCTVATTQAVEGRRPGPLQNSSLARLTQAGDLLASGDIDVDALMALTRDERSICRHPEPPFDYESCGAAIMRPATGDFWACWGVPSENDYEHFRI